jgi:cytochrome c-type biogenesis protein
VFTDGWADHLTGPLGVPFAFAAGVISFLSPCVLPLVPAYIAHLTGVVSTPEASAGRRETLSHALAFVAGFGLVFTVIGASVGLVGSLLRDELPTLEKIAGVFLIVLGLNLMGVIRLPWLYRTYQLGTSSTPQPALAYAGAGAEPPARPPYASPSSGQADLGRSGTTSTVFVRPTPLSYSRSAGFGAAFAVAWTPCIGPVLGAILTLAATSSTVHQGAYLLLAYSAGLALPFLVAGYALSSVTVGLKRFGRLLPALEVGTGAIVLLVGVLVFLNEFTSLNQYFDLFPGLWGV